MNAREQTELMLRWWSRADLTHADLAVRRSDGSMLWHRDAALENLPLPWARAENVRGSDVYIRPARGYSWPLLFLDDVSPNMTHRIMRAYAALAVRTSPVGGCHLWLSSTRALDEHERAQAQRWLAVRAAADPGSTSGKHLGRLAGFKNWKRGGVWVNLFGDSATLGPWDPTRALSAPAHRPSSPPPTQPHPTLSRGRDTSPSGREWGWLCTMLEAGTAASSVLAELTTHAQPRRGKDAARYAQHTLDRALLKMSATASTQEGHP